MTWIKSHWRWSTFNLLALSILLYILSQGSTGWNNLHTFDSGLESGKWAIRFLLACLTMSPLNTYFGWRTAIKLRKSAGLWAFGFGCTHILLYVREAKLAWLTIDMPLYLLLGLLGISILTALAVTSNRWGMQRLGKNWKRLHRFVYAAGITVVTHSMLAATMSKKMMVRDPEAESELKVYLAILSVLLVVRIPVVRQVLLQIPTLLKRLRKPDLQVRRVDMSDDGKEVWPKVYGRESSSSVKPTFLISNEISNSPPNPDYHEANPSDETSPEKEVEGG